MSFTPAHPADADRLAEWAGWRGEYTAKVDALPAQLSEVAAGINARLNTLDVNLNRRLDRQDEEIAKTLEQATKTNGRMNGAERDIATLQEVHRGQVEAAHGRQFTIGTLVASISAAATLGAAIVATLNGVGAI